MEQSTSESAAHSVLDTYGIKAGAIHDRVTLLGIELEQLERFKKYLHDRLDELGIPADPYPAQTKETGCRIGGRLDYIEQRLSGPPEV